MSRSTDIVIGARRRHDDPARAIAALFAMLEADAGAADRTETESHEFDRFCQHLKDESDDWFEEEDTIYLGSGLTADAVPSLYREGTALYVTADTGPVIHRLQAAIDQAIDPNLLGHFSLNALCFTIGEHDVFQSGDVDEPILFGRYFVSITINAREYPAAINAVREQIVALDEFRRLRSRFEAEFGPSEVATVLY